MAARKRRDRETAQAAMLAADYRAMAAEMEQVGAKEVAGVLRRRARYHKQAQERQEAEWQSR